jgi:hypothetical protein
MSHNTCCLQQEKRQDGLIYRSASGEEGGLGVAKSFSALPIAWNVASSHFSFFVFFFRLLQICDTDFSQADTDRLVFGNRDARRVYATVRRFSVLLDKKSSRAEGTLVSYEMDDMFPYDDDSYDSTMTCLDW